MLSRAFYDFLITLPADFSIVMALRFFPLVGCGKKTMRLVSNSFKVIKSKKISDERKEKILPRYSVAILGQSCKLFLILISLLALFCGIYYLTLAIVLHTNDWYYRLQHPATLIYVTLGTMLGLRLVRKYA